MSSLTEIIELLYERTQEEKIQWEMSQDGKRIVSKQRANLIEIVFSNGDYIIYVRNSNGIAFEIEKYIALSPKYKTLSELFNKARRTVLGTDKAISDIKNCLLSM